MSANSPAGGDRWLTDGNRIVRLREDGQRQPLLTLTLFATRDEATLIADAGNVRAETGLTPQELRDQRDLLLSQLKRTVTFIEELGYVGGGAAPGWAALQAIHQIDPNWTPHCGHEKEAAGSSTPTAAPSISIDVTREDGLGDAPTDIDSPSP